MSHPRDRHNIIEPFDPELHERTTFSCGVGQVDNFFLRTANKLSKADNLRVFVMTTPEGELIGFYALIAHAMDYAELPKKFARARPGHGSIPAAHISMIGVDRRFAGKGYGGDLLVDALRRIVAAAGNLGIAVILLDILDCGNPRRVESRRKLYMSYGFQPLLSDPLRHFLPVGTARLLLERTQHDTGR